MANDNKNVDFIKEQYLQYWQMKRFHLALSWHIPALAIAAVVAFIGLDPDKLSKWTQTPLIPAAIFLAMGMFVLLMFIHHYRNLVFARIFEKAIAELEEIHGIVKEVHQQQTSAKLKGLAKISSSTCLSLFLLILSATLLCISGSFWFRVFL